MGFELTPRERRWFDAILVLGALALGFIVLGFVGVIFADLRRPDHGLLPGLAASRSCSGRSSTGVTAIPFMTRTGAIFTVYLLLFGGLVVVTIVVAAALFSSLSDFIGDLPALRANLPAILAPWQERLNAPRVHEASTCRRRPPPSSTTSASTRPSSSRRSSSSPSRASARSATCCSSSSCRCTWSRTASGSRRSASGSSRRATGPRRRSSRRRSAGRSAGSSAARSSPASCSAAICLVGEPRLRARVRRRHDRRRRRAHGDPVLRAVRRLGPAGPRGDPARSPTRTLPVGIVVAIGWLVVMNWLQPRIMATSLRIHPIVVLGLRARRAQDRGHPGRDLRHPDRGGHLGAVPALAVAPAADRARSPRARPRASASARAAPSGSRASRTR